MSELTKEYFEGYLDAKFDEKLKPLATKIDMDLQFEDMARMVNAGFEDVHKRLNSLGTDMGELKGVLRPIN